MNVGFEAKRFFTNFTGLGNYSRFIIDAISKFAPENGYILYTPYNNTGSPEVRAITERSNVSVITPPHVYRSLRLQSLWRSWKVGSHPSVKQLNIFHGLSHELPVGLPRDIKKVVTVHDLIFMRYPQFYSRIDVKIYTAKVKYACKSADKVVAISEQTKLDLINFLKVDASKIEVIYQGCHPIFKRPMDHQAIVDVKKKYGLPDEYILNVGTIEERKNVGVLIRALALLPAEQRIPLVVVGRATGYYNKVVEQAHGLGVLSSIKFIHNAAFVDLPAIFRGARVFVYPSFFEGFGIPLIEAIESHVPVITSTGSCFREAAGPDAVYVDPSDAILLSEHLKRILNDEALRSVMIERSYQYVQKFTPEVIAGNLKRLYEEV